mmetsp:Transcript_9535/g.28679  ORF Transcript_9535/g.28679 Transcript_9535/m.28679 type:complete len:185 (-) Transcript_9535:279-833(-)|eukprot:CAMPEP_0206139982 /NCGR_PEP_ID=MMETSP1473-20131121/7897_1 /ASSEMBLY_ACC=CAM_ASM_001109 /TAXON_ID=1461547 /ORGANISM="Stichococcus sp, Strain RCC1054" /LENGTH=184 /DNA_ID=CAMNT_0053533951 /DNA_START=175 /DNA_END=729 /DNA_ORIENTATION=-
MADVDAPPAAYAHPTAALFTVLFKAASFVVYILSGLFGLGFISTFVICIVSLMLDFWTVKNVSGRLLVGLRYWNEVTDEGSNWRFESLEEGQREVNNKDKFIFWWSLYLTPALWAALGLIALLKLSFESLLVVAVAVVLSGANAVGFTKCSKEAKQSMSNMATNAIRSQLTGGLGRFNPFGGAT